MITSSTSSSTQNSSTCVYEGRVFDTKEELQIQLGMKCIEERFEYKVTTSNKTRFEARCTSKEFGWLIKSKNIANKDKPCFMVMKMIDQHTCSRMEIYPTMRNAGKKVLGNFIKGGLQDPSRVYRGGDIVRDVGERFKCKISYSQAWRGKVYALQQLQGTHSGSFSELPGYCHNLKLVNPGTVTEIMVDDCSRFEMFFVALGALLRCFSYHLRPVIIVDASNIKGRYLSTNFLAVGMDGNNQILPLAYGIGKTEDDASWTWFLTKLRGCIPYDRIYTFVSDKDVAIDLAISSAAPQVFTYLEDIDKSKWTRACVAGNRYNIMTSNIAESINSLSSHARTLPVVMLIEFFRSSVQEWFYKRSNEAEKLQHPLTSWAEKKIQGRMTKCTNWLVQGITNYHFQVADPKRTDNIVDIEKMTCDCRKWELSGLPCGHAIAVARYLRLTDSSHWASMWFTKETYLSTYNDCVNPVPDRNVWDLPSDLLALQPPPMDQRQCGKP